MERRSVAEYLEDFLRLGDECAYVQRRGYRAERWNYRRVAETAFQLARELEALGIGKGERVLLWGPNSAEWVAAFFGCALRGVIVVPIDDVTAVERALRVHQEVSARLLICSRGYRQSALPTLIFEELAEALGKHLPDAYPSAQIDRTDTLEIVFTSGTTAEPKGVVISHGNVLANMAPLEAEIRKYLKYEKYFHPVRFLNLLPLSHVFGQFLGIFLPQLLGGTVLFQDSLTPSEVIRTIRRERVSVLVAVPRMLQSLKEKVERDFAEEGPTEDFRTRWQASEGKHFLRRWWIFRRVRGKFGWKFWAFICGGAALDRETEDFWQRLGYAAIQGYGLTETTSIVSVNHPFRLGRGSIGKVLPGREVKLADDGEILVRGGGVVSGYWNQEGQAATGDDGWYRTGDIGELDARGNLYFKGRKKDVIVTPAGMNVYPEDLEAALRAQPEVKDCVVIALPRGGNAEPCAVLILHDGEVAADTGVRRANESLAEFQRMRTWFVWPEEDFPRTSTQKPRTNVIREVVLAKLGSRTETGLSGVPSGPLMELIARVKGVAEMTQEDTEKVGLDADLGLSSLDRVELLDALEDRYQIDLSETSFAAVNTVGDLERMLHGQLSPRAVYHYPRWTQRWPVTWLRLITDCFLLLPSVYILGWPRIEGRENLRGVRGPVLVICNHIADTDGGFVKAALPVRLRHRLAIATGGEALEVLRTPPAGRNPLLRICDRMKWALGVSLLNLFPLPREAGFRESFAFAGETVDRGYSVLLFPEGRHTEDGQMRPFQAGVGLLANNLRVPVVPMRIDGLFEVKRAGKRFARPHSIRVKIGVPVSFEPDSDPKWVAAELQKRVEAL